MPNRLASRALVLVVCCAVALLGATPSPRPLTRDGSVVRTRSQMQQLLRERVTAVLQRPPKVFQVRNPADTAGGAYRVQDAAAAAVSTAYKHIVRYCDVNPPVLERVTGVVSPGGTLTAKGGCFGSLHGAVQMQGTFPGGSVALVVRSWSDDTVTAQIPSLTGVPNQAVQIRVGRPNPFSADSRRDPGGRETQWSSPVSLSFVPASSTVRVPARYLENLSCGAGSSVRGDTCMPFEAKNCTWWCSFPVPTTYAGHPRGNGPADAGTDSWRLRLPLGWRLDRLELHGEPDTTVQMDQTIGASVVTWSVAWRTGYWTTSEPYVDHGTQVYYRDVPHYDGTYVVDVFATGPIGTLPE